MKNKRAIIAITLYISSIIAANWMTTTLGLVPIGFGLLVTAGTFAAGAALVLRDAVQQTAGRIAVLIAIAVGVVLSYLLADPFIATASAIAFAASELIDFSIFTKLAKRNLWLAVLISSIISAPIDTVLFLWIAGFDVTFSAVIGQFIVKTAIAAIAALWIARSRK
jgi:queuosine precursor transporter